jgi:hypothetical protein
VFLLDAVVFGATAAATGIRASFISSRCLVFSTVDDRVVGLTIVIIVANEFFFLTDDIDSTALSSEVV